MKKNKLTLIGLMIIYFIVILSISIAYSFCNQQLSLSGKVTIKTESKNNYDYTIMSNNSWQSDGYYYYNYTITINYLGEENINSWTIYIDAPFDTVIDGCYSVGECYIENSLLKMNSAEYNGKLNKENRSFSIGFQFHTSSSNYDLIINNISFYPENQNSWDDNNNNNDENNESEIEKELKDKIIFDMYSDNSWGNITSYTFSIKNESQIDLKSWQVQIQFNESDTVNNLWGAQYIMKENILIISSPSWSNSFSSNISEQGGIQMNINSGIVPFKDFKVLSIKVITSNMKEVIIK